MEPVARLRREKETWSAVGAALDARDRVAIAAWMPHARELLELIALKCAEFGWAEECVQASRPPGQLAVAVRAAEHAQARVLDALHQHGLIESLAELAQAKMEWPEEPGGLLVAKWLCAAGAVADDVLIGFLNHCAIHNRRTTFDMLVGKAQRADVLNKAIARALGGHCDEQAGHALDRLVSLGAKVDVSNPDILRRTRDSELTRRLIRHNTSALDLDLLLEYACIDGNAAKVHVLLAEGAKDPHDVALSKALAMRHHAIADVLREAFSIAAPVPGMG